MDLAVASSRQWLWEKVGRSIQQRLSHCFLAMDLAVALPWQWHWQSLNLWWCALGSAGWDEGRGTKMLYLPQWIWQRHGPSNGFGKGFGGDFSIGFGWQPETEKCAGRLRQKRLLAT
jgi:hypothetical protein